MKGKETKSDFVTSVGEFVVWSTHRKFVSLATFSAQIRSKVVNRCEDGLATFMSFLISQKRKVLNKFFFFQIWKLISLGIAETVVLIS